MLQPIIKYFVDRKRATLLLFFLIVFYGFAAYQVIPKESSPDIDIPFLHVVTTYEGISPEDSEKLLTKPMENELRDIEGLKQITSYSNEGSSSVMLEFDAGFDSKSALEDVRAKVSQAKSKMPLGAEEPRIIELNISLFPVLNIFMVGDLPLRSLRGYAEDIQENLEALPEVLEAKISGLAEEVIEIEIEPKDIVNYNLSTAQIEAIVRQNNRLVAAGVLKTKTGQFALKVPGLIENYYDLLQFPIKVEGDRVVKLQDIATVKRTFKDPSSIVRVNGKSAIAVEVVKRQGENIIETVAKVKQIVEQESETWPQNLSVVFAQDESDNIKSFVDELENNILVGMLLVLIVILISVGPRSALLIALSLPASFLAGILFLSMTGVTLNIVVLFSLILTVGMIVDDAIVISEYADMQMQKGAEPKAAFPFAAYRMFWPVITSTVVKLIVFMPLLAWPNLIGQFMRFMPITVIAVLINSSLYALVFQPSLGVLLGRPKSYKVAKNYTQVGDPNKLDLAKLDKFRRSYAKLLMSILLHAKKFLFIVIAVLFSVYIFFATFGPGSEFFPDIEPENAYITIQSTDNLSIYEIDEKLRQIEEVVLQNTDELKVIYARAGDAAGQEFPSNTVGFISLELEDWSKRRKASIILDEIKQKIAFVKGVNIEIISERSGPVGTKPIRLDFSGPSEATNMAANKVMALLQNDHDYKGVEDSRDNREIEWRLEIDRTKLAIHNVDLSAIGASVRLLTNGFIISSYIPSDSDEEIDVVLRFPPQFRKLMTLDQINIITPKGAIPLSHVAELKPNIKVSEIKRVDRKQVITILSDVAEGVLVNNKTAEINKFIADENFKSHGVRVEFLGDEKEQQETANFLINAFLLALIMMFLVMLIQFNSFYHTLVVMSAVFLSSVGVLIAHIVTWQPFGIVMSGVGIIALGGIVLNNNILYIDTYQRLRKVNVAQMDAIILAGIERFRPILLTAFTAVLGLMPMVLGLTINFYDRSITYDAPASQWWRQLSTSIVGGLSFATMLTLFFTPCLLIIGKRFDIKPQRFDAKKTT